MATFQRNCLVAIAMLLICVFGLCTYKLGEIQGKEIAMEEMGVVLMACAHLKPVKGIVNKPFFCMEHKL